ncbi:MAG TPA: LD-carboxypeptidase [Muribaculum sp.]|jgi:muramoyltetrapeptide carboxypeptidase|uniref:S66 peptidase family protein n=1 Tax=Heminiphilus faecis TaxID=2601703 RepID=UPI000EF5EB14|nr:LD-carboxypeptidase [Heminiphilus faecis]RLT76091.1 LD-carboxypeptidase [bacterium J10(2018)]HRF68687.1 LD-carboxypeptidase [Muribaculum sp.]
MAVIYPAPLRDGDVIAVISPASIIEPDYVTGTVEVLRRHGWTPEVSRHALGRHGSYSGSVDERLADLNDAICDPAVRAILCSRGGYGTVHLLDRFPKKAFMSDPKWIIGFSDISALHAMASSMNVASIHSPMCKHLAADGGNDYCSQSLFSILRGERPEYTTATHPYNKTGETEGIVVGGNLAVLDALISTPYDIFVRSGSILFIEDIAEPIYKVERMLYRLKLSGIFDRINGLLVGRFTEYNADRNYKDMYDMIREMTSPLNIPVAFDFPVGHVDFNLPLIESAPARLIVDRDRVNLTYRPT